MSNKISIGNNEERPQNRNLAGATVNAPGAKLAQSSTKTYRWVFIGILLLAFGGAHAINVTFPNGDVRFMSDSDIYEMRTQSKLMGGSLTGLQYSGGVFLTIHRDGIDHFSSFSPGTHELPKLPPLVLPKRSSWERQTKKFYFTVLPHTLMVVKIKPGDWSYGDTQVHLADQYTNTLRQQNNLVASTLHIQPFHSDWEGVYGLDGVFNNLTSSGRLDLSSPGVSFIAPPKGRCVVLWWGENQRPKVCSAQVYIDQSITSITVVEQSSEPEGIVYCWNGFKNAPISVKTQVVMLNSPWGCDRFSVPEGHEMLVEDDVGRRYWVEGGRETPLSRYIIGSLKRMILVKGGHHHHPRIWSETGDLAGNTFASGDYNITRDYNKLERCEHLWVPEGYKVIVTRSPANFLFHFFYSGYEPTQTFTAGQHFINHIMNKPIISIEVIRFTGFNYDESVLDFVDDPAIEASVVRQLGVVSLD